MRSQRKSSHEGIDVRHSRSCPHETGGKCNCKPGYQASIWDRRTKKRIRKTFGSLEEAKSWRREAQTALKRGTMKPPPKETLDQAADKFLDGLRKGTIRNRSGHVYKPSVVRSYETALRLHVLPDLGPVRLGDITRNDVQAVADRLLEKGLSPSAVRNALMPLRVIYRRAMNRSQVAVNPTHGLELPAVEGKRDRIADPTEAAALIAAVPEEDQALWATAFYSGLRRGELRALRWEDVDIPAGVIRVERAWDAQEGEIIPKTSAAIRSVPIPSVLRSVLAAHRLRVGRATGRIFATEEERPFDPSTVTARADKAWAAAGLDRITLHECRHTYASLMIAAGVNAKALCSYMGHTSLTVTYDRYGHLMPGNEVEAATLLDAYLDRALNSA